MHLDDQSARERAPQIVNPKSGDLRPPHEIAPRVLIDVKCRLAMTAPSDATPGWLEVRANFICCLQQPRPLASHDDDQ